MRKIGSEKDIERKKKRIVSIFAVFMLAVLIGGTVGYGFLFNPGTTPNDNTNIEEGTVINVGNQWAANIQGQTFYFSNSPESVKNISVNTSSDLYTYGGKTLYISSNNSAVINEIGLTLGRYASRIQEACYGPCSENLPEKNCSDNLIIWQDNPLNKVYQEESCIFIEGDLRAVDAFLYDIFGLN